MNVRIPWIRRRVALRVQVMPRVIAAAVAVAGLLVPGEARATARYVVNEPIHALLERTGDADALCRLRGISTRPVVVFVPPRSRGLSVYWHAPTDRFVQYPGTGGCAVWKRRGP